MNIGIIVYSQTGNTNTVSEKLKDRLSSAGHSVEIERLMTEGEVKPGDKNINFISIPETDKYNALVFGSPVQAFSLSSAMRSYLNQIETLKDKKIACFITKHLVFNWTGGNRAIRSMRNICEEKGGIICATGIVIWSSSQREGMINDVIEKISKSF